MHPSFDNLGENASGNLKKNFLNENNYMIKK